MLESILHLTILISGIILIVMGLKQKDEHGKRTKAGITMMVIGGLGLLGAVLWGLPDFIEGFKAGFALK